MGLRSWFAYSNFRPEYNDVYYVPPPPVWTTTTTVTTRNVRVFYYCSKPSTKRWKR